MKSFYFILYILFIGIIAFSCSKESSLIPLIEEEVILGKGKPQKDTGSCSDKEFTFELNGELNSDPTIQTNCVNEKTTQFIMSINAASGNEPFYFDLSSLAGNCLFADPTNVKGTFSISLLRNNTARLQSFFNTENDGSGIGYELIADGGIINGSWLPTTGEVTNISFDGISYGLIRQGKGKSKNDECAKEGVFGNLDIIIAAL